MPFTKILTLSQTIGSLNIIAHPVIVFDDSELVLCDAGYPGQVEQINSELNKNGFSVDDITKIVITHHDHDHRGSLSELRERNRNLIVISSEIEAPYIEGQKKSLRLIQAEELNKTLTGDELQFGIQFADYIKTIQDSKVDQTVKDGDYIIPGLRVISTPGHTPGHISLFCEDDHTLITGDALAAENGVLVIANPQFTLDPETSVESIRKIRDLAPQRIICYHGGIVEGDIQAMLNDQI